MQDIELYTHTYDFHFFLWLDCPQWARPLPCRGFWMTLRHTTLGRTSLDKWSAHPRDLYLTTHMHERQTSIPPAGFEPTISASEPLQTHALYRAATEIGIYLMSLLCSWRLGLNMAGMKQTETRSFNPAKNINLSLSTPLRRIGEWSYSSSHSCPRH